MPSWHTVPTEVDALGDAIGLARAGFAARQGGSLGTVGPLHRRRAVKVALISLQPIPL
jgi:hypothetical protein